MFISFDKKIDYKDRPISVEVEAFAEVYEEKNLGADADGNRGRGALFIDHLTLTVKDSNNIDITTKLYERANREYKDLEQVATEKLEEAYFE